jgi:hypothetical protein
MSRQNQRTKIALCMALITMALAREATAAPGVIDVVNCNNGKTITAALSKAQPGDTILVQAEGGVSYI